MNVCVPVAKRATRFEGVMRDDDQADKSEVNNQSVLSCWEAAEKFQAINAAACEATSVDGLEILKSIYHFSRFDSHLPFFSSLIKLWWKCCILFIWVLFNPM